MTTPPRLIDAFIDRLIELAAGAEPVIAQYGISMNIRFSFGDSLGDFTQDIVKHLGSEHAAAYGPGWSGPRGKRRRKLCFDVAVQAIASAEQYAGGYRSKWE